MSRSEKKKDDKPKISTLTRISFLPSVFTMLNLFLGYQALIYIIGSKQNFKTAIYYITASVIMDGFDGTIARLTKPNPISACSSIPWSMPSLSAWSLPCWLSSGAFSRAIPRSAASSASSF